LASDALTLSDVDAFYGDSHVLHGVSFRLAEGRLLGLLGRNGAGKTTTMSVTVGLLAPRRGEVAVYEHRVTGSSPEAIAAHGVALVPQGRRVFRSLTVRENLAVAGRRPRDGRAAPWTLDTVYGVFPRLRERHRQLAGSLSGGEQQMLAIARALAGNPEVLMLDEPSQGLAPRLVRELETLMLRLKGEGVTILLVEQNARMALGISDRVLVLGKGTVVFAGPMAEFRQQEAELKGRYLSV
jgi:branched-chain amino acid transport system ATP-binding protein